MKIHAQRWQQPPHCGVHSAGFTLPESLILVVLVAILAAIGIPAWMGFFHRQQLATAQDMVYQGLRATQMDAMQNRHNQQFSIREQGNHLEWASHPSSIPATQVNHWTPLVDGVVFADNDNTLLTSGDIHYVKFDFHGNIRSRLGTVTLQSQSGGTTRRCVVVSTLIGAMRRGENHPQPNSNGRYCY